MKVYELIKELEKLPQDATIGTFDEQDMSISDWVNIYNKTSKVFGISETKTIKQIEQARYSNESRICDYYVG